MPPNDAIDDAIRSRRRVTGQPAVDALNSAVPQADPAARDALEERLLARLDAEAYAERNPAMNYTPALRGATYAPRRLPLSTSLLMTIGVATLCALAVFFARLNQQPPENDTLPVAAPINNNQEQANPTQEFTATPTPLATLVYTATPTWAGESRMGTATPVPADNSMNNVPPAVWLPGDGSVSAPAATGLLVPIPMERLVIPDTGTPLVEEQTIRLATLIGARDSVVTLVPVSGAAYVISVDDILLTVRVPLEQGIVLNWLLYDTASDIYVQP